ncbi:hypothetical protein [Paramicrobacterium fandaimingii]|uniref:hypothetical protein n=1 Tax=Paramicrobacterium fandaimingii TaxID=2708079 RepID=UPI001F48E8B2|nr:hypothetical protein [Microbacterium fandaimingii]
MTSTQNTNDPYPHSTTPARPAEPASEEPRAAEDFTTSSGLRALLDRLHSAGPGAWSADPVAQELMRYAADKYAALARKHHLDPWEAASAAFDVMRTPSARRAMDPWAVVTRAVQVTCIAEDRAQGLLCSVHQARRPHVSVFHDAERFSDRENPLTDYHPAFQMPAHDPDLDRTGVAEVPAASTSATAAVDEAIRLFVLLDWAEPVARQSIEHVSGVLARTGARHTTFENLRRDKYARHLLDLPKTSWSVLLKVLLGNPHPAAAGTSAGRGVLLRLLIGETLELLLRDDDLVLTIALAAPARVRE